MKVSSIKNGIGIYSASATIMSILIPVPILASIAQAFPDISVPSIQLIVAIPSLLAIAANFVTAKLASRHNPRVRTIFASFFYIAAGAVGYFFHDSFPMLVVAACLSGLGMGGIQNSIGSLISNSFEGDARGAAFGLCSVFVGLGGFLFVNLSSRLGAQTWYNVYLAFFSIALLIVLQFIFLPAGTLEPPAAKGIRTKIPRSVIILCAFGFFYFGATQIFNSNISMLIADHGLGGTVEAGTATSLYTLGGMAGGLLVFPIKRLAKFQTLTMNAVISVIGCLLIVLSPSLLGTCSGAVLMAIGFAVYNPIESQLVSEASGARGLAFNLALMSGTQSIGQALSPYLTSAAAFPFGNTINSLFYVGVTIFIILGAISGFYFRRYTLEKAQKEPSA